MCQNTDIHSAQSGVRGQTTFNPIKPLPQECLCTGMNIQYLNTHSHPLHVAAIVYPGLHSYCSVELCKYFWLCCNTRRALQFF